MSRRRQLPSSDTAPEPARGCRWPRALATAVATIATATLTAAAVVSPAALHPTHLGKAVEAAGLLGFEESAGREGSDIRGDARTDANDASDRNHSGVEATARRDVLLKRIQAERKRAASRSSRSANRNDDERTSRRQPPQPPAWLRACTARGTDDARSHSNGQLPSTELCPLPVSGHLLHADAAHGWWQLNRAFTRRFGSGICITDSYRSYDAQTAVYAEKPGLAAVPGTSNHGWGVAMDLCGGVESYTSPEHLWLAEHGAKYGWVNPSWAQVGGSLPEPWHWEFVGR